MTRRRRRRRLGRWLLLLAVVLGAVAAWQALTWPDVAALARTRPATTAFIERWRAEQRAAGRPDRVAWTWVDGGAISSHLKRAVLVAEDINFLSHRGFDTGEMREAVARALEGAAPPRGASTITQQLAKNLWLSPSRNPLRKVKEAALTWQLERTLGKRRILELYVNVVELGPGVYGAEAASRRYFGKAAAELSEDDAAQLAAALPRPRSWHPGVESRAYRAYVDSIRRRMDRAAFLHGAF
ncbi:MAG: monofunctional biosynthetic peptidoglycan transglycosylase [Candidatus Rokubacteria bacterium]|nr:monofunctional biosynthetic peptidoglycan transglycosylase [Candidatus Rokubacteria bacterium]